MERRVVVADQKITFCFARRKIEIQKRLSFLSNGYQIDLKDFYLDVTSQI